jgi:hypothetical protein
MSKNSVARHLSMEKNNMKKLKACEMKAEHPMLLSTRDNIIFKNKICKFSLKRQI